MFLNGYTECAVVHCFVYFDKRLHYHVYREIFPLQKYPAQDLLIRAAFFILAMKVELAVYIHLAPADLIYCYHGAFRLKAVEFTPKAAFFFLDRKGGNFPCTACKGAEYFLVFFKFLHNNFNS
jgi:hypothetical protein